MRRFLLLGALAAVLLVPVAAAAPAATGTFRGTVVAKDRAHHVLVVARLGGEVQTVIAKGAFARTGVGRSVVVRFTSTSGQLPVAVSVSLKGHARKALIRGTIVRIARRHAVLNAGGSLLRVTMAQATAQRTTASAKSGPAVGDEVEIEVEIEHGALAAGAVVSGAPVSGQAAGGEMEVRGVVAALTPAAASVAGSITVTVNGLPISCAIPVGLTLTVAVGDPIELECDLVGDPGVWTVHVAKAEDEHGGNGDHSGPGKGASDVEVRGTIAAPFQQTSAAISVTPGNDGAPVTCSIVPGSLPQFAAGDSVKIECVRVGDVLQLKEIEKRDNGPVDGHGDDDRHGEGHDDGGGSGHDDEG